MTVDFSLSVLPDMRNYQKNKNHKIIFLVEIVHFRSGEEGRGKKQTLIKIFRYFITFDNVRWGSMVQLADTFLDQARFLSRGEVSSPF